MRGHADFIVGDAQNLPFKDGAFDKSLCTEVFEHIPDDRRGIAEFVRVTKPGAHVAVSVPAYWPERAYWALSWDYWHSPGGHVRWYRPGEMRQILEESGMRRRVRAAAPLVAEPLLVPALHPRPAERELPAGAHVRGS